MDCDSFIDVCKKFIACKDDILVCMKRAMSNEKMLQPLQQLEKLIQCDDLGTGIDGVIKMVEEEIKK